MSMSPWLWVSVIVFGGLWLALNREKKLSKKTLGRLLNFVLFSMFVISLLYAPWPFGWGNIVGWLVWLAEHLFGFVGRLFGLPGGAGLATAFLLVTIALVIVDLIGKKPDKIARFGVIVMAVLAMTAGGPIGGPVEDGFRTVAGSSVTFVQNLAA